MLARYLIFCLIWLLLSAFGTFMGYNIFPDTPIFTTGVLSCLISWVVAMLFTVFRSVSKGEIELVQKEAAERAKYKGYPGSAANHIIGINNINGHLYMFPESLVFHPHTLDENKEDWNLPYEDIAEVKVDPETKKLCIESKSGTTDRFAVADRQKWINDINAILSEQEEAET